MPFFFLIFEAPYRDDKDTILSFISILTSGDNYFQIRQSQWTPVFFFVVFDNQHTNKSIMSHFTNMWHFTLQICDAYPCSIPWQVNSTRE